MDDCGEGKGEQLYERLRGDLFNNVQELRTAQARYMKEVISLFNKLNKIVPQKVNELNETYYTEQRKLAKERVNEGKGTCGACQKPLTGETCSFY